jgi:hypothetical protein
MQDPRILANSKNLNSYRTWEKESYRRSGFFAFVVVNPALTALLTVASPLIRRVTGDAHGWVIAAAAALLFYLLCSLGLMVFAAFRLRSWKRDHPWAPPSPHIAGPQRPTSFV